MKNYKWIDDYAVNMCTPANPIHQVVLLNLRTTQNSRTPRRPAPIFCTSDYGQDFAAITEEGTVDAVGGAAPVRLNIQPPAWDDFSSGEDSDQEDDER